MPPGRRLPGYFPQLERRAWEDVAPELARFLRRLFDAENAGIPPGWSETTPREVSAGIVGDPGAEVSGWASGTHQHGAQTDVPVELGLYEPLEGTSESLARADHVHPHLHLEDDLEVMWRLEEPGGDRVPSVGVHLLTESGTTVGSNTGKVGEAAEFNASHLLYVSDPTALQQGEFDFAVTCWVYLDSIAAVQYFIAKDTATDQEYVVYFTPNGGAGSTPAFRASLQTTAPTTFTVEATDVVPTTGTWYFLHFWYDHAGSQIFLRVDDGTTFTTDCNSETPKVSGTAQFMVGGHTTGAPADFTVGRIDAVHWYNRNLTEYEHLQLYNEGDGREVYIVLSVPTSLITHGGTILLPTGPSDVLVWEAPFACQVTAVRAQRVGGSGATVNMRKNGTLEHLSSDLSLATPGVWTDGGVVQNVSYSTGDSMEARIKSATGAPSQVAILARLLRT